MATVTTAGPDAEQSTRPPETDGPGTDGSARPVRRGFRTGLLLVLIAALLASLATAIWLAAGRRGEAEDVQAERERVMVQTRQFLLRMGTYGPDLLDDEGGMPEYRERVRAVITPKFAASFDEQAGTAEQLVAGAGVSREAEVFSTGVSDLDPDSATTLVAGTFTDSYPVNGPAKGKVDEKSEPQEPVPYRIEVSLVKVDGEWLVDDFTPVTGEEQP
jgi:Mce-associated membrane protein